jgi:hypothetical protein
VTFTADSPGQRATGKEQREDDPFLSLEELRRSLSAESPELPATGGMRRVGEPFIDPPTGIAGYPAASPERQAIDTTQQEGGPVLRPEDHRAILSAEKSGQRKSGEKGRSE